MSWQFVLDENVGFINIRTSTIADNIGNDNSRSSYDYFRENKHKAMIL